MKACELGRILWVMFLVRARKVTRPSVREPTAFDFDLCFLYSRRRGVIKLLFLLHTLIIDRVF